MQPALSILAHGGKPHSLHDLWRTWGTDPGVIIPLVLSVWLYGFGLWRLWRDGHSGRGIKRWEAACFAGGWFALVIALVSPLHPWGRVLFSAHMTQHEVLMLVAAPLLVMSRPLVVFLVALPPELAKLSVRWTSVRWWQGVWKLITNAFVAWIIHAVVLWIWHIPSLFDATVDNEWVHAAQHASFVGSALLFWWAVIHGKQRAIGFGVGVLYMFTTALHSGLLGALITFASRLVYPAYAHTTQSWGLTPLEDQQLGGLIMWIPAAIVYIIAGLALFAAWMRDSERRVVRQEMLAGGAT
jgi:putative membrane protein